jgi:hypothetical protein
MKKRNILISVLFGLVLAFGMLVASCDNGVLPKYESDPNHQELELEAEYDGGAPPGVSIPDGDL